MIKQLSIAAGLALALGAGVASAQNGGSGTAGSGTAGTGVDVLGALVISNNPSTSRSTVGGLANAIYRITEGIAVESPDFSISVDN